VNTSIPLGHRNPLFESYRNTRKETEQYTLISFLQNDRTCVLNVVNFQNESISKKHVHFCCHAQVHPKTSRFSGSVAANRATMVQHVHVKIWTVCV